MKDNIVAGVTTLILITMISPVNALQEDNTIIVEVGTQYSCNSSEDSLGCVYRVLLDTGILEHPKPLDELRIGFNMTTIKVMRFI